MNSISFSLSEGTAKCTFRDKKSTINSLTRAYLITIKLASLNKTLSYVCWKKRRQDECFIYIYVHLFSNLKENSYKNMMHSSSEEIPNYPDNKQNSSFRLNYEYIQNEIQSVSGLMQS